MIYFSLRLESIKPTGWLGIKKKNYGPKISNLMHFYDCFELWYAKKFPFTSTCNLKSLTVKIITTKMSKSFLLLTFYKKNFKYMKEIVICHKEPKKTLKFLINLISSINNYVFSSYLLLHIFLCQKRFLGNKITFKNLCMTLVF